MSIKDFHFYHGAVLTKILRLDIPTSLKLVETSEISWCTYTINDSVALYMKHSKGRETKKHIRYVFNFDKKHLKEIKDYIDNGISIKLALICINNESKEANSEICLIDQEQLDLLIDLDSITSQTINVYLQKGKSFRVDGTRTKSTKEITVSRNAIDNIEIPS
ncbi:hypothetical protein [Clostridium sp. ZBS4]|uniref:hypothetical protein n=1 Tax=Clostridium sp. ZBS4 TaxID=2949974 RepID=UPI00207A372E|nr:hypothetical protein [Clostridium sp. ZBS4]